MHVETTNSTCTTITSGNAFQVPAMKVRARMTMYVEKQVISLDGDFSFQFGLFKKIKCYFLSVAV